MGAAVAAKGEGEGEKGYKTMFIMVVFKRIPAFLSIPQPRSYSVLQIGGLGQGIPV